MGGRPEASWAFSFAPRGSRPTPETRGAGPAGARSAPRPFLTSTLPHLDPSSPRPFLTSTFPHLDLSSPRHFTASTFHHAHRYSRFPCWYLRIVCFPSNLACRPDAQLERLNYDNVQSDGRRQKCSQLSDDFPKSWLSFPSARHQLLVYDTRQFLAIRHACCSNLVSISFPDNFLAAWNR